MLNRDHRKNRLRWFIGLAVALLLSKAQVVFAQPVTLNFKEAELESVIGWVAEQTGKNFIVDPRVKSKVTIISGKPLNKDEVYQVFLSVLQVHGFAAVPSGSVIKIMPDINAKQSGVPIANEREQGRGDEMITRVISLQNVSAAQLVPILRPLLPQQGHMAAYPASNMLIISDRAINIDRITEIIDRIDLPSAEGEVEVVSLRYAAAGEVIRILTVLEQQNAQNIQKQGGDASVESRATFVADDRTNSILLGGGKSNRLRIRALISHLDVPLEKEGNIHVIYLRYANAKALVPVLTGIGQSVAQEEQAKKGGAPGGVVQPQIFNLQADESTNALVINASIEVFRSLQAVIRQLDVRRAVVLVEAVIAEVSTSRAAQLGIQWVVNGGPGGHGPIGLSNFGTGTGSSLGEIGAIAAAVGKGTVPATAAVPEGLTLGIGRFNSSSINFAALVHALEGDGSTNVLSTPNILTIDNQEAEIVVGQNVPIITGSYSSIGGSSTPTNPFQTYNRENVGIDLKVKPQVNEGNSIKLDIEQKVDSIAPNSGNAVDIVTNKRSIKTTVMVDDGEVVVLGGLIKDDLQESTQKIPLLGDLPLLGGLFRYKTTTKGKTNLMVFLHPVIMRDETLLAEASSSKYNYIRAKQMQMREKGVGLLPDEEAPVMAPLDQLLDLPAPFADTPGDAAP